MLDLELGFDKPWYLLLLALLPLLWILSFRSLAGLGNVRRLIAIGLRSLVLLLIVLALAEVQLLRTSHKMTVTYLLDQSESIPREQRIAMLKYVIKEVKKHRNRNREDRASVIVFGKEAKIEVPPFDDDIPSTGIIESIIETDATNLAAAMKLSLASFLEDSAGRIVIITDGNENLGDARSVARTLVDNGIGIDVVPVTLTARAEIAVEKVAIPSDIRKGQAFETRVVIHSDAESTPENSEGLVTGRLKLSQHIGSAERLITESNVTLKPGKNVFSFRDEINHSAMFTYKAIFTPDDPGQDLMPQNNQASAYTHVRGEGHVLLIEDWEHPSEFDYLVTRLREQKLEVTVIGSDNLFSNPIELLEYDSVILANVPRSSGDPERQVTAFSDEQIRMLAKNTEMGCGLVMLGGDRSFGAGGWTNTDVEKAMPVDFYIKNQKVAAVGALVLMMHASEMAQGNHWQKIVAREAIKTLGPMDYCGLIHWDNRFGNDDWLWSKPKGLVKVVGRRKTMLAKLDQMAPGDMPEFDPAMKIALAAFNRKDTPTTGPAFASVKHMIVISDGDPGQPANRTINDYIANNIQVTTVAVGAHGPAGHRTLQDISLATKGKYYVVTNPKALPRIYQREVRRVTRRLINEPEGGVRPMVTYPHEILGDLETETFARLDGYVFTTIKENPLVVQSLIADKPDDGGKNSTLLATWNYGLGKSVAFTSDAGSKWADGWVSKDYYDKFFGDMIRWSMRPINNDAKFTVATDAQDGKVRVIVTALDKDDEFLNFLEMNAQAISPDLESIPIEMRQESSGRYVGEFETSDPGSYLFAVMPGGDNGTIRGGVNIPYSSEFRDRETNEELLISLASLKPEGGEKGAVLQGDLTNVGITQLLDTDTFRHNLAKAVTGQDVWPIVLVVCGVLFLADVFIRRVTIGFEWFTPVWVWIGTTILGRDQAPVRDERMARLRNQKEAISERMDERRAAARFELQVDADQVLDDVTGETGTHPTPSHPSSEQVAPDVSEGDSYTSRLFEAKKRALKDRGQQ